MNHEYLIYSMVGHSRQSPSATHRPLQKPLVVSGQYVWAQWREIVQPLFWVQNKLNWIKNPAFEVKCDYSKKLIA